MPDHLHERHRRRAQGRRARPALPRRPAPAGRALARRAPRRARVVHGGQRLEQVGAQRLHRARGCAARRRCCTTSASTPSERLAILDEEPVAVLCMAPTEYRVIAKRAAAAPDADACAASSPPARRSTPRSCAPGTRPPACGSATATARPRPGRSPACRSAARRSPGSMGRPLPGIDAWVAGRRARRSTRPPSRPSSAATSATTAPSGPWHTGDRVTQDDEGFLFFEGRDDDVIISAGYRIGPFEVESALVEHPAVAEAAVVAAPDDERGAVVRAVVVLRDGHEPVGRARARAAGPRQGPDGALQVPAHRRLRRRAAQDGERQGPRAPRAAGVGRPA